MLLPSHSSLLFAPRMLSGSYLRAFALPIPVTWLFFPQIIHGSVLSLGCHFKQHSLGVWVLSPGEVHCPAVFSHIIYSLKLYSTCLFVYLFVICLLSLECSAPSMQERFACLIHCFIPWHLEHSLTQIRCSISVSWINKWINNEKSVFAPEISACWY